MNRLLSCSVAISTVYRLVQPLLMRRMNVCVAAVFWGSFAVTTCSANSPLLPSDLLIANLARSPGVFQFRGNSLVQAMTNGGPNIRGASPTPDGKIVSTWEILLQNNKSITGIDVFDPLTGGG